MAHAREQRRLPDAPPPRPEFFLAVFQSGVREARIYRAYPDPDGISFVYAGPAVAFLDLEVARGQGRGGRKVQAADSLKTGLVSAAGAGLVLLGVLIVIAGRLIAGGHANAGDFIGPLIALVAAGGVGAFVALAMAVRRIARRAEALDALSAEEIRAEAQDGKWCFRAAADNVRDVCIDPPDQAGVGQPQAAARLSFRHDPTGKWKLRLLTRQDARAAARAFRRLLGKDGVEVNVSLPRE